MGTLLPADTLTHNYMYLRSSLRNYYSFLVIHQKAASMSFRELTNSRVNFCLVFPCPKRSQHPAAERRPRGYRFITGASSSSFSSERCSYPAMIGISTVRRRSYVRRSYCQRHSRRRRPNRIISPVRGRMVGLCIGTRAVHDQSAISSFLLVSYRHNGDIRV